MKNIHMYNYLLAIKDETHIYKAIIEAVPDENDSMMIGLDDFNFPQEEMMLAYKQDQSKRENLHQWYNRKRMIQRQRKAKENGK